jgi:23S rRNA (uridine2552-2'-O)-methyltransferase
MAKKLLEKNFKKSSRDWLLRQLRDPFVSLAKKQGYRSRAAFKIIEIQEKFRIFMKQQTVLDLGAAPGGWSQVVSSYVSKVIAVDLLKMDSIDCVHFIEGNFLHESCVLEIKKANNFRKIDVIMSDMAPSTCGIKKIDHLRILELARSVFDFSLYNLEAGGSMIIKIFQGGTEAKLLSEIKKRFKIVRHFKPESSRKSSSEMYLVATNFGG